MVDDRRLTFIGKWVTRANDAEDEFDRFFSAWIALVVAAQRVRDQTGRYLEEDSDRQRVIDYFRVKRGAIATVLEQQKDRMTRLAKRRGTVYQNLLVDTGNRELRLIFRQLSRHYTHGESMQEEELVVAVAEFLNKVRNNVFHGLKVYDDRADLDLLGLLNPVLLAILKAAEGWSANSVLQPPAPRERQP